MTQHYYLETELDTLVQTEANARRFLQEGSFDGIWFWDLENPENEWMSPEFWHTFGYDPATKRSDPAEWQDIIFEEDLSVALQEFEAHWADPDHPFDQVLRYHHSDGSVVWIRCRGLAIRDEQGKPLRMLGVHTNITAMKQSELDASAGWIAAETANEELESFSYSMSHDMKAPANTLDLLLNELILQNEGKLDDDSREILLMCTQTVDRMKNLIEYVLEYTRVVRMPRVKSEVSLSDVTTGALKSLDADIADLGAVVEVGPLPNIIGVRKQMDVLMLNLISNAIKYCPKERKAHVRVHSEILPDEGLFRISVTDNGEGIPAENQDRVFKLFQRLHGHSEIPGSGIGLAMCNRIAQNHSGKIELVSSLACGSTFSLCLPIEALA